MFSDNTSVPLKQLCHSYNGGYSVDALGDLREIYSYIANELLAPETAAAHPGRIRKEVRSLDFMPARYTLASWEPVDNMLRDIYIYYGTSFIRVESFCFILSSWKKFG